ncbi:hypothetical protein RvY_16169 [Ramazzottius varieornatus]|uniref:Uncharacterized protein n=1 Tax=Ramazzottius varieornatus TaxID=947166 RepID=A0A1D1W201_RAMVA|nr:hypothetical protein RvY_16169 [Ramazzottius varieornatus]
MPFESSRSSRIGQTAMAFSSPEVSHSSSSLLNRSKLRLLGYLFSGKGRSSDVDRTGMVVAKRDIFDAAIDEFLRR